MEVAPLRGLNVRCHPAQVARRRLKRPLRRTDPATLRHAPRVSLASASIEKSASSKQEDDIIDAGDVDNEEEDSKENKQNPAVMDQMGAV